MAVIDLEEKGTSLRFILKEVDTSLANAIRRTVLGDVPTLAIEEVEFYDNTSSLYDEMLAHRLSLIPIVTDLDLLNFREECKCEAGCPSCQLELSLKKKGPGTVYSQDLKSSNKKMFPLPGIPIVKLGKDQNIELRAVAVLGRGEQNSKWQPAVIGYKYYPVIEISKECNVCKECVDACPQNILEIKKQKLRVTDERLCTLCKTCVETCDMGAIQVKGDKNRFIYKVEATGSLQPAETLARACEILINKAEELKSKL